MGHQQHGLRKIAHQPRGRVHARRRIDHDIAEVADQQIKQAGEFRRGGFHKQRRRGACQQLQAAAVPGHEAFQQRTVEAVQVANRVRHA